MTWKNIKTFLILLFLCINVFLLMVTFNANSAKELSQSNINDAVKLLESNNIFINKSIIPKEAKEYSHIELSAISQKDQTRDNMITKITLSENPTYYTEGNFDEVIKKELKKYGFNTKNIIIQKQNDKYYISEKINNMQIFNNSLVFGIEGETAYLTGTWYDYQLYDNYADNRKKTVYATSALITFITEYSGNKPINITDICFGYYAVIDKNTSNAKSISAAPCYRLTDSMGNLYYYNIYVGSFV